MSRSLSLLRSRELAIHKIRHRRPPSRARLARFESLEPRTLLSNALYVNSANNGAQTGLTAATGYTTIGSAIEHAESGYTILVETGDGYTDNDTVNVPNLTIEADASASPPAVPVLSGGQPNLLGNNVSGTGFTVAATGVTISGFTIEGFDTGVDVGLGASATSGFAARLAVILLAAGPCGYASGIFRPRKPRARRAVASD
jgi:hypothetical protein